MDFSSKEVRDQAVAMTHWLTGHDHDAIDSLRRFGGDGERHQATFKRAMGVGASGAGDKLAPPGLIESFYTSRDRHSPVRENATVIVTDNANALHFPRTDDAELAVLVAENAQEASADIAVTEMVLRNFKYASKIVHASRELVDDAGAPFQQFLGRVFGKRIGRATNAHFTTGTGSGQPTGIVTASTEGKAAASTTTITYGELVDLMFALDLAYQSSAQWMMSRATLAVVRKLQDSASRPIFADDKLLGRPVVLNDDMPSIGASAKPIIFGDLSLYLVREVDGITLRNYSERYIEFGQVGLAAWLRTDGNLLDSAAVKHLQMAS